MFIFLSIKAYTQKKELYVFIDYKYQSLFKFNSEVNKNKDYYFSSIKILKDKNKDSGFIKKNISKEKEKDIIVVSKLPVETNYYEFQSYEKPEEALNIDTLKVYSIKDISKQTNDVKEIWGDYRYSVIFIEKINCKYRLWKMKPLYLE